MIAHIVENMKTKGRHTQLYIYIYICVCGLYILVEIFGENSTDSFKRTCLQYILNQ